MIGIDANYDAAQSIIQGRLFTFADYAALQQGYLATKRRLKYLSGEKVPERIILPGMIVDKAHVKEYPVRLETRKLLDYDEMAKKYGVW